MSAWECKCIGARNREHHVLADRRSIKGLLDQGAYWLIFAAATRLSQRQSAVRLRDSAAVIRGRASSACGHATALGADRCTARRQYDRTRAADVLPRESAAIVRGDYRRAARKLSPLPEGGNPRALALLASRIKAALQSHDNAVRLRRSIDVLGAVIPTE